MQAGDNWNEISGIMNISGVANHAVSSHFLGNACTHIFSIHSENLDIPSISYIYVSCSQIQVTYFRY